MLTDEHLNYYYYRSPKLIEHPDISVVISTYNRYRAGFGCDCLVQRALESILNQTFKNFEIILIDDCSSDETEQYCRTVTESDPRVRYYRFHKNSDKLPAKRYNFGISISRGKYIAFMFDDDKFRNTALNDLFIGIDIEHPKAKMVYGLGLRYTEGEQNPWSTLGPNWNWALIYDDNVIANNTVIIKKEVFDYIGGYDETPTFARICDWDLWYRIGRKCKIRNIHKLVSDIYEGSSDSILAIHPVDFETCKLIQRKKKRVLPLQIKKEPLSFALHSCCFDIYHYFRTSICYLIDLCVRTKNVLKNYKKHLKKILPKSAYNCLKKMNQVRLKLIKKQRNMSDTTL